MDKYELIDVIQILDAILSFSESSTMKKTINGLLNAKDGRVYPEYNINSKTYRLYTENPNFNSLPENTVWADNIKELIAVMPGSDKYIYSIDYCQFERTILANLTGDENLINPLLDDLDIHILTMTQIFSKETESIIPRCGMSDKDYVNKIQDNLDKIPRLKHLRQKAKTINYAMSYLAHPKTISEEADISLEEAQNIWEKYHETYKQSKIYRYNLLDFAKANGYIPLGLGANMKVVMGNEKTLWSAICQFWSILTPIAVHNINAKAKYDNISGFNIFAIKHDCIYIESDKDSLKWLHQNVPFIMEQDFMYKQPVKLKTQAKIGRNLKEMFVIHDKSIDEFIEKNHL